MEKLTARSPSKKIGMHYEKVARDYLLEQGYAILEANYNCKLGEIDIVASRQNYIVFIEVKYRKNACYGYPREYVNYTKQQRIVRIAKYYIMTHKLLNVGIRFDVIDILDDTLTHIMDAFN